MNDIPEDNIVTLQEENDSLQSLNNDILNSHNSKCVEDGYCGYNLDLYECFHPQPGYNCNEEEIELHIGMEIYGGIIFYVDETGNHGLVSAKEDIGFYPWSYNSQNLSGASDNSLGGGEENTLYIINNSNDYTAAHRCSEILLNGYDDWYLPTETELLEMYNSIGNGSEFNNLGNFETEYSYWSSLSCGTWTAHGVGMSGGDASGCPNKSTNEHIRPIRSF